MPLRFALVIWLLSNGACVSGIDSRGLNATSDAGVGEKTDSGMKVDNGTKSVGSVGDDRKSSKNGTKVPPNGACISQGGYFPPFAQQGNFPRKIPKGVHDDLTFCRIYKGKTCCGRSQADLALISTRRLAIGGEASNECLALWEALECAICHPAVGTQSGPPAICVPFCDRVYDACRSAFFSADANAPKLVPCGPQDTLCSRASEWATSGTDFCQLAGFRAWDEAAEMLIHPELVLGAKKSVYCFDGTAPAGSLGAAESDSVVEKGAPRRRRRQGSQSEKASGWGMGLELGENIRWLIAGLVLTAGGAYFRWRARTARRRRAALFASRSMLEARARQQAAMLQLSKAAVAKEK